MKVLLVEDEPALRSSLKKGLNSANYTVEIAPDGEEGLFMATEYPIDLAIVDLGLPKLDGISLIQRVRAKGLTFPILILTARDRWQDKVEGLEAGADDYVVKPFQIEEVIARINALLRRVAGSAEPVIRSGDIFIDTSAKEVKIANTPINLTKFEYRVLEHLSYNQNKVFSKQELIDHIYEEETDPDPNSIEVFIGRLRKKLKPFGLHSKIQTVRGLGYKLLP